jgi:hypothetical protein
MFMTNIYLELGERKVAACSLEWPGWCRFGKSEELARQALINVVPRYQVIARRAGLDFRPGELVVIERVNGDATTNMGAPSIITIADTSPVSAAMAKRGVALLRAAWAIMDEVVAASSAELRKGPRGGGRERDQIVDHVIEAERAYARKIGVRHKPFPHDDLIALSTLREEIIDVLGRPSNGLPMVAGGWPAAYATRRIAWHVIDHIWEIEDRQI